MEPITSPLTEITGRVNVIIDALGHTWGSTEVARMLSAFGPVVKQRTFRGMGPVRTYRRTFKEGVSYIFDKKEVFTSAIIQTQVTNPKEVAYSSEIPLVDGLSDTASRQEVLNVLGTPEKVTERGDRFEMGSYYVMFSYNDDSTLEIVSVMSQRPEDF